MKLTAYGAAAVAAAQAGGAKVNLTHVAVGDGNGQAVAEPTGAETALVREVYRNQIAALYINATDNTIFMVEMTIPSTAGGWSVREIGVYDVNGQLFAYGNFPETYKPLAAEGSTREMVIVGAVKVANASTVQLVVDTNVVLASRQWVLSVINAAYLLPGGFTGQFLAKKSNADGDVEWVNPLSGVQVLVNVISEVQTLAENQTIVNFSTVTTYGLAVYIEGVRLIAGTHYNVNTGSRITLARSYPAGTKIHVYQNDPLAEPDYLRPALNLSDVSNKEQARTNLDVPSKAYVFFMGQN